ncbi:proton-translocating transhydrogenase family protein [Ancylobacter defluvii]|uniref:proton-translocating NAD(P)(+) transhydrogenase n=1 Tax=Ancylobacter defluvii TaxID=1282440 RepID=A0A9W6NDH5_9HYPH|nr:proton-translocating transhydrogenase family protein [Ancylobacter defluvii]MBS7587880.1 NAD(P) transhydrogenase subunit alpha [Ancylobacter defluvii]GLK86938.1 NAD(P) transhydrogenase subunit alpha [Ancylobacter defluvii]
MANPSGVPADPAQALEGARAAAEVAKRAAEAAQAYADAAAQAVHSGGLADMAGAAAHTLTGGAIDPFVFRLAIFVLAVFVGYYVVWSVTPALHTPLMSVTNAISSVIVVGALLAVGVDALGEGTGWAKGFGFIGLILASVNIFGGFLVTSRMLAMYSKKK